MYPNIAHIGNPTAPAPDPVRILGGALVETYMDGALPELAKRYRVSCDALALGRVAFYPAPDKAQCNQDRLPERLAMETDGLAIPLRDPHGEIVGVRVLPFDGGVYAEVGESALFTPWHWDAIPGIVAVVSNPIDALALWTVDVCAAAVPVAGVGLPMLIDMIRQYDMADRGWFFVGEANWAMAGAAALRAAGIELAFWNRPPLRYSDCHGWVYDRIPTVTCQRDLADLGNTLAAVIEGSAAAPNDWPMGGSYDPVIPPPSDLTPVAVKALCPTPAYREYLSAAARTRRVLYSMEVMAAEEAGIAAARGDTAEKTRWLRIGERISVAADEEIKAIERAAKAARQNSATSTPAELLAYVVSDRRICHRNVNARGEIEDAPICNFTARITGEAVHDDGAETSTFFAVEGALHDGRPLPTGEVRADEYDDMKWVTPLWGAGPIVYANRAARNNLRVAIQVLSGCVPRRTVYAHTGWREVGGRWVYLHAGGAIGGTGPIPNIAVRLPDSLTRFRLPEPPLWGEVGDIRASLAMLSGLAPDRAIYPLYAATWRSVLGNTDLTVALNGLTGTFKSELGALDQQHWGGGLDARHLPANWHSTANALEAIAHAAKDALLVIDDYCPPSGPDAAKYHQKADQVLRGAGNGAGRQRMNADTSLRPAKPPRCLIVSTGEESPRGQSLQARMMQIDVAPGAVNAERLTECQRDAAAGRYARAMAAYLQWLAPQYTRVKAGLAGEGEGERALAARSGQHRRTPAIVAELMVGLIWFLRFAQEVGAISAAEALRHEERCRTALGEAAGLQTEDQSSEEPAGMYVRMFGAVIAAGRCHVAGPDGGPPGGHAVTDETTSDATPGRWGWRLRTVGLNGQEWQPLGPCVGWVVGPDLYLEPDASFAAVVGLAREQGDGFHIGTKTMRKRLWESNLLASRDVGRGTMTVRRTLGGVRDRTVLHFRADTIAVACATCARPANGEENQQAFDEI